jgi:response regulator RpfG family c-di-GMP phosphodiesterase
MTRITEHPTFEVAEHLERICRHVARLAREFSTLCDQEVQDLMWADIAHGLRQIGRVGEVLRIRSEALSATASTSPSL